MNEKTYYVYIEANKRNRVFYVEITNNIVRRDKEHENNLRSALIVKYDADGNKIKE